MERRTNQRETEHNEWCDPGSVHVPNGAGGIAAGAGGLTAFLVAINLVGTPEVEAIEGFGTLLGALSTVGPTIYRS
jgi:hypothetical protein